jgi:glycosyltransferase involved in cell wall biosynthesis
MSQRPDVTGSVSVVVPCYNESERLDLGALRSFAEAREWLRFVLVDDGSTDATRERLEELAKEPHRRFEVLALQPNQGKAEAVRRGIRRAVDAGSAFVGFWDADLATPLAEIERFRELLLRDPRLEIVVGSRVRLVGHRIERNPLRHYFGRLAATVVSILLGFPVYDTQCGAKLFRVTPAIREAFEEGFATRWEFDVEILARWLRFHRSRGDADPGTRMREVPVSEWRDVPGSRLRPVDLLRAPLDLLRIRRRYPDVRRVGS